MPVMQIASGLHRVGADRVNSYLVVDGDGVTIVDAGLPGYWKLLLAELASIGKSLDDVYAAKPFADFDAKMKANEQQAKAFMRVVYMTVKE